MCGMTESAQVRRINQLCEVYLHKSSGKRYYIAYSAEGFHEMHQIGGYPISGPSRYVSAKQLENAEIWSKV
jgi:uncharacterized protein (UPF0297 family)